nr:hypothetical protein BaRGS_034807 [Batillaria attramentaria]
MDDIHTTSVFIQLSLVGNYDRLSMVGNNHENPKRSKYSITLHIRLPLVDHWVSLVEEHHRVPLVGHYNGISLVGHYNGISLEGIYNTDRNVKRLP